MADQKGPERTDILIEGNTASWDININGDVNGTYSGTFRFRCFLTPTQHLAAGRRYRELLGANPTLATVHDDNLAYSLSQLKERILSAPPFWTSNGEAGDLPDENVIDEVLKAAIDAELKYKVQLKKKRGEALEKAKKAAERMLKEREEEPAEDGEGEAASN